MPHHRSVMGVAVAAALAMAAAAAGASPFDCARPRCGLPATAPYPHLVVGHVDGVATPAQARAVFEAGRGDGRWRGLPDDAAAFADAALPISLRLASGQSLTLLTTPLDGRASALQAGDLVRFAPHRDERHRPARATATELAYWAAVGCVMVLCRAEDAPCHQRYQSGVYRLDDGIALDEAAAAPRPDGVAIDTMTMLPKRAPQGGTP